jgi:hypothetical protein
VEKGSVHRARPDYLLKAGAGQTMSVHLVASGGVCFDLYTPGLVTIGHLLKRLVGR